jgi:hypothetical protein
MVEFHGAAVDGSSLGFKGIYVERQERAEAV